MHVGVLRDYTCENLICLATLHVRGCHKTREHYSFAFLLYHRIPVHAKFLKQVSTPVAKAPRAFVYMVMGRLCSLLLVLVPEVRCCCSSVLLYVRSGFVVAVIVVVANKHCCCRLLLLC